MNYISGSISRSAGHDLKGRTVRRPLPDRIEDLKLELLARGLRAPESPVSPGAPNVELIARIVGSNAASFANHHGSPRVGRTALNALVDELGFCDSADVIASIRRDPIHIQPRKLDDTMEALLIWAEKLRRVRGWVPVRGNLPCFVLIAEAVGHPSVKIANADLPYRRFLIELSRELGTIDYSEVRKEQETRDTLAGRISKRAQRLSDHITVTYIKIDAPLPESRRRPGFPPYCSICSAAGVSWKSNSSDQELKDVIDRAAALVGIGADRYRRRLGDALPTYGDVLQLGAQWFSLENGSNSNQAAARVRWALRYLLRQWGAGNDDQLDPGFEERCRASAGSIATGIENPDTRRHWLREIDRWQMYVARILGSCDGDLPDTLGGALQSLLRESPFKNIVDLARTAGVMDHIEAVRGWIQKDRNPVATDKVVVSKLELALGVEPGILAARIRRVVRPSRGHIRDEYWPTSLHGNVLRKAARPLLPHNFAYLPAERREEIGRKIRAEWEGIIEHRQNMRTVERWLINPNVYPLGKEIDQLVEYKTSSVPDYPRTKRWKDGTVDRSTNVFQEVFSAMALPRDVGGLGIAPEQLSFAYLALPSVIAWYGKWLAKRYPKGLNIGARVNLGLLASITTAESKKRTGHATGVKGYLHYVPELRSRLAPIDGFVSQPELAAMQTETGWHEALEKANSNIWQIFLSQNDKFMTTRDPFEPILPILESPRPMDALVDMLELAYRDLPNPNTSTPLTRAIAVRALVLALIAFRTALRRSNLGGLTYRSDNRGQLKRRDGLWVIEISADEFKNEEGSFFQGRNSKYVCTLEPEDSELIDEYVNGSRKLFNAQNDWLFVSKTGERRTDDQLYNDFRDLTWLYLVHHEITDTGIEGVERFGLHAVRDIVATHILKVTGDIGLAADALQDTQETIMKHYAHYLPDDRTKRVRRFFAADLRRGGWHARAAA